MRSCLAPRWYAWAVLSLAASFAFVANQGGPALSGSNAVAAIVGQLSSDAPKYRDDPIVLDDGLGVLSIRFIDEDLLVGSGWGKVVGIWDCNTGVTLQQLEGHRDVVSSIAISSKGARLITCSDDRTIRIWDLHGRSYKAGRTLVEQYPKQTVAIDPSGAMAAWAGGGGYISVLDIKAETKPVIVAAHEDYVQAMSFSPNGLLASGSRDCSVCIYDHTAASMWWKIDAHAGSVRALCLSDCGRLLATGGVDGNLCVWNIKEKSLHKRLSGFDEGIRCIEFLPGTACLAVSGAKTDCYIIDVEKGESVDMLPTVGAVSIAVSPHGTRIAIASGNEVKVWKREQ